MTHRVAWDPPAQYRGTRYRVYMRETGATDWGLVGDTEALELELDGLEPGQSYDLAVAVQDRVADQWQTPDEAFTTVYVADEFAATPPPDVHALTATDNGGGMYWLRWLPVVGDVVYEIRRGNRWHHGELVAIVSGLSYRVSDARWGTETYMIRARDRKSWLPSPNVVSTSVAITALDGHAVQASVVENMALPAGTFVNFSSTPELTQRLDDNKYNGTYTSAEIDAGSVDTWYWSAMVGSLVQEEGLDVADQDWNVYGGEAMYRDVQGREASYYNNGGDFDIDVAAQPWDVADESRTVHGKPGTIYPKVDYRVEARFDTDGLGSWTPYRRFSAGYVRAQKMQVRVTVHRVSLDYQCDVEYINMAVQYAVGAGGGDVDGPGSATDNAIARWDGTSGKLLQDSLVAIDDSGNIVPPNSFALGSGATVAGTLGALAIGLSANAAANYGIAIGNLADAQSGSALAIGRDAEAIAGYDVAIGWSARADGSFSIALGTDAHADHEASVALGREATTTASNQMMVGSASYPLDIVTHGDAWLASDSGEIQFGAGADYTITFDGADAVHNNTGNSVRFTHYGSNRAVFDGSKVSFEITNEIVRITDTGLRIEPGGVSAGASYALHVYEATPSANEVMLAVETSAGIRFSVDEDGDVVATGNVTLDSGDGLRWGGANARIDGNASGPIEFYAVDGTQQMELDATGLRIEPGGVSAGAGAALDVQGEIHALNDSGSSSVKLLGSGGQGQIDIGTASVPARLRMSADQRAVYTSSGESLYLGSDGTHNHVTIDTNGNVGIGTTGPDGTLHVHSGSAGTVTANPAADDLVVEGAGAPGISILGTDAAYQYLMFGSPSDNYGAALRYRHSDGELWVTTGLATGELVFGVTNASEAMRIDTNKDATFARDVYAARDIFSDDPFGRYGWSSDLDTYMGGLGDQILFVCGGLGFATFDEGTLQDLIHFNYNENQDIDFRVGYNGGASIFSEGSTGNVGIGTTSPAANLEIEDGGTSNSVLCKITADDQSPWALVIGNDTFSTNDTHGLACYVSNSGVIHYDALGGAEHRFDVGGGFEMGIVSGGVGIGTTNPSNALVVSDGGAGGIEFQPEGAGSTHNILAYDRVAGAYDELHFWTKAMQFRTGAGATLALTIDSSQDVGIGIAPTQRLHVADTAAHTTVEIENTSTGYTRLYLNSNGAADALVRADTSAGDWAWGVNQGSSGRWQIEPNTSLGSSPSMTILRTGEVGFGTSSPDGTLHVHTASAGSVTAAVFADDLVVENDTDGGITILTPNDEFGYVAFGDPDDNDVGFIRYRHTNDDMSFFVDGDLAFLINSNKQATFYDTVTIDKGSSGGTASASELILEDNSSVRLSIMTPASTYGEIAFGDDSDGDAGRIRYDHSVPSMAFYTEGTAALTIDSSQRVGMGIASSLLGRLHVKQSDASGAIPALVLEQSDTTEKMIGFYGSISSSTGVDSMDNDAGETAAKVLAVKVWYDDGLGGGATEAWLRLYDSYN